MRLDPPLRPPAGRKPGDVYRLYFFDDGAHITKSHEFFAANDDEAAKRAESWREGRKTELWQRGRFVKHWD
jgi:hypothetical protein